MNQKIKKHKQDKVRTRAQMSVEYLFVIAFAMALVMITAVVFFMQSKETSEEQQLALTEILANDILSTATRVYYSGDLSQKTVRTTMPAIINNIYVSGDNALVFNVTTEGASYDLTYYADVPVHGVFPSSKYYTEQIVHILVYNYGDYILLCTEEFGCEE